MSSKFSFIGKNLLATENKNDDGQEKFIYPANLVITNIYVFTFLYPIAELQRKKNILEILSLAMGQMMLI